MLFFLLKGKIEINSKEYSRLILAPNQFILQPIGSEIETHTLEDAECVLYTFDIPQVTCPDRYQKIMETQVEETMPRPLEMCAPMQYFMKGMVNYLNEGMICKNFMNLKKQELVFILNCYYPVKQVAAFMQPVISYSNRFRYFVAQNHYKVKNVEELALLGGYSVVSFRRIFKNIFGMPAYQWMIKRKCENILEDLKRNQLSISEIAYKYLFDSLPQFSNFCKTNFGKSPREIRKEHLF